MPILNHAPRGFTRQLAGLMAANVATAGDLIVLEGDDAGVVHFMESGSVYVLSRHTVAREIRLSGRYLETMSLKVSDHVLRRARFWFYHASRVGSYIYIYMSIKNVHPYTHTPIHLSTCRPP